MAMEPENLVLAMLREIRAKQDEHSARFVDIENRLVDMKKQADDQAEVIVHVLGQSSETSNRAVRVSRMAKPSVGVPLRISASARSV